MKSCGAMCGNSFSGMQAQARKTRTFAYIPNVEKGSTPLISTKHIRPKYKANVLFLSTSMCGDCVGTLRTTKRHDTI